MSKLSAVNISFPEAGDIPGLDDNTVMISINEEYEPLRKLRIPRDSDKILTVRFSDITSRITRTIENETIIYEPINEITAHCILDFINKNADKNFIVHCKAGISRSAAVCLYIHIVYGHNLKLGFWTTSLPNKYVLGSLFYTNMHNTWISMLRRENELIINYD
jgi:hypothetical protein